MRSESLRFQSWLLVRKTCSIVAPEGLLPSELRGVSERLVMADWSRRVGIRAESGVDKLSARKESS
jgi:hypothetical protein